MNGNSARRLASVFILVATLLVASCGDPTSDPSVLTADLPLHLEDHLDVAKVEGSEAPRELPEAAEWNFDEPQPDWKPARAWSLEADGPGLEPLEDALRVSVEETTQDSIGMLAGGVYVDLPDWERQEWGYVAVRARASGHVEGIRLGFNLTDPSRSGTFQEFGDRAFVINDGQPHTYLLRLDSSPVRNGNPAANWLLMASGTYENAWRQLGVLFGVSEPAKVDLLSVAVVPKEAVYTPSVGVAQTALDRELREVLYMKTPGLVEYRLRVPKEGRLDVGLGAVHGDVATTFRIVATADGERPQELLKEALEEQDGWLQRSIDLAHLAGRTIRLELAASTESGDEVALWATPTLSGSRATDRPNIIFYVIDGGSSSYMSLYGYNRRTTPFLERLAAEGAVFETAFSNSSWTRPSTISFLTSLQHSVLGGSRNGFNRLPEGAQTIAERLQLASYQTALFTDNANAGTLSGLERGHDVMRETRVFDSEVPSSRSLHERFWRWRASYPGEPYYVHFQTTDVHGPHSPLPPFAGLFIDASRRRILDDEMAELMDVDFDWKGAIGGLETLAEADRRVSFFTGQRDLHDETMAQQDYELSRLVAQLKAEGQWEHTLLIVAADHGVSAGAWDYSLYTRPSPPADLGGGPMVRSGVSRIPLLFVWPERIAPGQRLSQPVSMIDILPTILDLADLPMPEVMQGQSLAPLLLGETDWQERPVFLDQFSVDSETGVFRGFIEMVDGRWGASLQINPEPSQMTPERIDMIKERMRSRGISDEQIEMRIEMMKPVPRPAPLLLFDLWNDPMCLDSLHEERPELVAKYTALLEQTWREHQRLGQKFTRSEESPLTPEQLQTLRALGYI